MVSVFKAAIGGSPAVLKHYIDNVEPYLKDPVTFPKIQVGLHFVFASLTFSIDQATFKVQHSEIA